MKKIVLFGSGDNSNVILDIINEVKNFKVIGVVDKKENISFKKNKLKFLGNINFFLKNLSKSDKNLFGIVTTGFNFTRKKIVLKVKRKNPKFQWATLIHPSCKISKFTKISEGSVIVTGAIVNNNSKIGKHCLINTGSSIDHDNIFEDYSSCAPGVVTGGKVKVGNCSYIGIGSTVKHGIIIGKDTLIGGHSFVNKNCQNNSVYYGVPIKKIKKRKSNSNYL